MTTAIGFPAGSAVLEVGCGVGAQTVTVASRSPEASLTAIDLSAESLAAARKRAREWSTSMAAAPTWPTGSSATPSSKPLRLQTLLVRDALGVLGRPRADGRQRLAQGRAEGGQRVFDVLGSGFLEHSPFDQAVALHAAQGITSVTDSPVGRALQSAFC